MPMLAFPTRYRPRNPNTYVSPAVLTPPEDDVPAAFDPNAINAQNQDNASFSPPPDEIPKPPQLNDTQAGASIEKLPPLNPDVASKSTMPAFSARNAIMPPPGAAPAATPAIQPATNVPPATPPATPSAAPAPADVAKQTLADVASQEKALATGKAPEPPKSNWAQRLGLAVLSMTKLAPHANQIIHPKWSEQEAAYERGQKDIQEKLKGADTALSAVTHGEEQEGIADQRRNLGQSYEMNAETRAQAALDRIAAQKSARNQKFLTDITKGHDSQYQKTTDPLPLGWTFTEDPENKGFGFAISPAAVPAPEELLPYLPGVKKDELVSYSERKAALDAKNKADLERTKADVKPDKPITNEYQGVVQEFTDPKTGVVDYAKANAEFDKRQAQRALASRPAPAEGGTWSIQEDNDGKPVEFNSKTGESRPVSGIQKAGTQAKIAAAAEKDAKPVRDALDYATSYLQNGVFTGSGDEALQEKFFELAKPTSGFRMTKQQMDMLQQSRGWMQGASAKLRHATTGTWFSDDQRKQIVQTMQDLANSKVKGGSPSPTPAPTTPPPVPKSVPAGAKVKWSPGQQKHYFSTDGGKSWQVAQ